MPAKKKTAKKKVTRKSAREKQLEQAVFQMAELMVCGYWTEQDSREMINKLHRQGRADPNARPLFDNLQQLFGL